MQRSWLFSTQIRTLGVGPDSQSTRRALTVDEVVEELQNSDGEDEMDENDDSEDNFDGYLDETEM